MNFDFLFSAAAAGEGASPSSSSAPTVPPQIINGQPYLPFQLQIEYTNSDGDRCLRVITKAKPITTDRLKAEKGELIVSQDYYYYYY